MKNNLSNFIKNLSNLIKVKTLVTLTLTLVFAVLSLTNRIASSDFLTVFLIVISFYFGTQSEKNSKEKNDGNN